MPRRRSDRNRGRPPPRRNPPHPIPGNRRTLRHLPRNSDPLRESRMVRRRLLDAPPSRLRPSTSKQTRDQTTVSPHQTPTPATEAIQLERENRNHTPPPSGPNPHQNTHPQQPKQPNQNAKTTTTHRRPLDPAPHQTTHPQQPKQTTPNNRNNPARTRKPHPPAAALWAQPPPPPLRSLPRYRRVGRVPALGRRASIPI